MHTVKLQEATRRLAELIDEVASGEDVIITRDDGATVPVVPLLLKEVSRCIHLSHPSVSIN